MLLCSFALVHSFFFEWGFLFSYILHDSENMKIIGNALRAFWVFNFCVKPGDESHNDLLIWRVDRQDLGRGESRN